MREHTDPAEDIGPSRATWSHFQAALGLEPFEDLTPEARLEAFPRRWGRPAFFPNAASLDRLRLWVDAGSLIRHPAEVDVEVAPSLEPYVETALRRLPPAALDHVTRNATLDILGGGCLGRCRPIRRRSDSTEAFA